MSSLVHEFVMSSANRTPDAIAINHRGTEMNYQALAQNVLHAASALIELGLARQERIAVFLPKQFETVIGLFAALKAGGIAVPVNPMLKRQQTVHILQDSGARILITNMQRLHLLGKSLHACPDLHTIICVDMLELEHLDGLPAHIYLLNWIEFLRKGANSLPMHRIIDADVAMIMYTSGSTGKAKGVVLSHHNIVAGAKSVAGYLGNTPQDRLLAVLPLSFDYGFSQLTTAFYTGASVALLDYLLPQDVLRTLASQTITGLAAVPTIWLQLCQFDWPAEAQSLRYVTNSGGRLPVAVIKNLKQKLPATRLFSMYGFTEAFRSTYLSPGEIEQRPDSIGKPIPNVELKVVREDGSLCAPNEPGELVHIGSLVACGYWNNPQKTAQHFRPVPGQAKELPLTGTAAWSGDIVRMDEEGYFYFVGRKDDMIKTSGYRVSPTEVEEVVYATGLVKEAVAFGVPHPVLETAIVVMVTLLQPDAHQSGKLMSECKKNLPGFMLPQHIEVVEGLPTNANGKIDRKMLAQSMQELFAATDVVSDIRRVQ